MLHFEGDQDFAQAPAEVWAKLSDPRFLTQSIPDVASVAEATEEKMVCTVRPGFAFVRGSLEVTLRVTEKTPPTSARWEVHSRGIGSSSDVEAALTFAPQETGTRVHWNAEVKHLGGLLKAVPKGLLKAAAQKVISDVWASVAAKLAG